MSQDIKARVERCELSLDNIQTLINRFETDTLARDEALAVIVTELDKQIDLLQRSVSLTLGEVTKVHETLKAILYGFETLDRTKSKHNDRWWE